MLLWKVVRKYFHIRNFIKWKLLSYEFQSFGSGMGGTNNVIRGAHNIQIGYNFVARDRLQLETFEEFLGEKFHPEIIIGDNVSLNYDVHIGACNRIVIEDDVLIGSKVFITDHFHGKVNREALKRVPRERPLFSKGQVHIKKSVWIGEGVSILPGVTIGENAIIGANAVVTHDIPSNSVAVGNPARVIKFLK